MAATRCIFVSDLHGDVDRYDTLFDLIARESPGCVLLGGDLLPSGLKAAASSVSTHHDFVGGFLATGFEALRTKMGASYPEVHLILGNDDLRIEEAAVLDVATTGLWHYSHNQRHPLGEWSIYGYSFVAPSPFLLKDWERYDVSRFVDPGCVSPEEGYRSIPVSEYEVRYSTIARDLELLAGDDDLSKALFLFHSPPYGTGLDRAALDGKTVEHVPLDVHVGSIAIRRFIRDRQPLLTLHGHIHESSRITGVWRETRGRTLMLSAAHDGPELAVVRFSLDEPLVATRELL